MQFSLLNSFPDQLETSWNNLLEESISHVPFLRFEYLRSWWQTRGGGEWSDVECAIVLAHDGDKLVGIAPFFIGKNRNNQPALMLLGSIEVSDFLDFIVRETDLQPFLEQLIPYLVGTLGDRWQVLDLYNFLDTSPSLVILQKIAANLKWNHHQEILQHSPFITLPGDWEVYLEGIDKKQRHEIRRKIRRFESADVPTSWRLTEHSSQLEGDIEAFMHLMQQDPAKAAFLTPAMREHMQISIRCAFEHGCLHLAFLEVDGENAAGYLSFDYLDRIWVYNSGIDRRFMEYSPGWVLLGYLLKWANENKRREFDFMRGDEEYKYRFGAVDRFVVRVMIERT